MAGEFLSDIMEIRRPASIRQDRRPYFAAIIVCFSGRVRRTFDVRGTLLPLYASRVSG